MLAALPSASSTIDLMIGTTANEASIFFWPQGVTLDGFETAESFDARVREFVVGEACQERILDTYALPPDASSEQRLNTYLELISDAIFLCPMRAWSSVLDASQQPDLAQLYRYHFTHIPDFGLEPRGGASFALGAYHSAELPYVFGTLPRPENTSADCADAAWYEACCEDRSEDSWRCCGPGELRACYGPDDRALSDAMMGFWSSFARDGAPNGQAVEWNAWDPTGQRDIRLEWPLRTGSWLKSETCAAWDEYWLRVCR